MDSQSNIEFLLSKFLRPTNNPGGPRPIPTTSPGAYSGTDIGGPRPISPSAGVFGSTDVGGTRPLPTKTLGEYIPASEYTPGKLPPSLGPKTGNYTPSEKVPINWDRLPPSLGPKTGDYNPSSKITPGQLPPSLGPRTEDYNPSSRYTPGQLPPSLGPRTGDPNVPIWSRPKGDYNINSKTTGQNGYNRYVMELLDALISGRFNRT